MENQQNRNCCDHSAEIRILKVDLENHKLRSEQTIREFERWQSQQDRRLDILEQRDTDLQREATESERSRYSMHFGAAITIVATIISALLTYLFSLSGH